ncbi:MAG TPA: PAS domain-containing protein [Roseiarcus sp.]
MKLAVTMELYAYWRRLRGARSAPERNDVDPGAIRGVLADTFVLDFEGRRGFPFRIAGSRANAFFLKELRGLSFLELWRDADRAELASILHCVADEAQAFLIGAEAAPPGLDAVDIEVILLPLRHHGLTHSRVLGGFAPHATPAWTGLIGAGPIALTSLRALDSSTREALTPEGAAPVGFSLRDTPRRYKHLFVYSGDRGPT